MDFQARLDVILESLSAPGMWQLIVTQIVADAENPEQVFAYEDLDEDNIRKRAARIWRNHNIGAAAVRSIVLKRGDYEEVIPNPEADLIRDEENPTDPDPMVADQLDFGQHLATEMKAHDLYWDPQTNRITDLQKGYSFRIPSRIFHAGNRYKIVDAAVKLAEELREMDLQMQ